MNGNPKKIFILGLDCADPELLFDRWRDELPTINKLIKGGVHGKLRSVHPPITSPAWACMTTGSDPGELGIYGFRHRKIGTYDDKYLALSDAVKKERIWEKLGRKGKKVIVLGVPQTFPVMKGVNGYLVSSFLTPSTASDYTWPPELKNEIESISRFDGEYSTSDRGYMLDVEDFRSENKKKILREIFEMTEKRTRVAMEMMEKDWDFFMAVFMGPDRVHHGFWKYMDEKHKDFIPGNPYKDSILNYYRYLDSRIKRLIERLDEDTNILLVSDHGAKRLDGCIAINEWLIDNGYLKLKNIPDKPARLKEEWIDWSETYAWGWGGYFGRIFVNLSGREPKGKVLPQNYDNFLENLREELIGIPDRSGNNIGTRAYRPEEIYKEINGDPPDLLVYFGDLNWRSSSTVGTGNIHLSENDTGPDHANHAMDGFYILKGSGIRGKTKKINCGIRQIAPTVLKLMGFGEDLESDVSPIEL